HRASCPAPLTGGGGRRQQNDGVRTCIATRMPESPTSVRNSGAHVTIEAATGQRLRVPFRHVAAVFIGNGLEFYDFLTFSYFAVYIGRTFFPSHDPATGLLASLATFGIGFATRPIGAIVIGGMGDRVGRKPAMLLSFSLM